jgi:hypothetical protein
LWQDCVCDYSVDRHKRVYYDQDYDYYDYYYYDYDVFADKDSVSQWGGVQERDSWQ